MDLKETGCEDVEWIHLGQDRNQWQAFGNTVMNVQVLQRRKISPLAEQLLAS
jgi:hypothetical protein